jgi:hypothetical protein
MLSFEDLPAFFSAYDLTKSISAAIIMIAEIFVPPFD